MHLNSKLNQLVFYFPPNFWSKDIIDQYKGFYNQMQLPYDNIDDFVLSTLQSISFPPFKIGTAQQIGYRGSERDYKGAGPLKDDIERKFTLTFKSTEGFMNYMLIWNNMINYLDFRNKTQYFDAMHLGILNNEGYLMEMITFKKVILTGISNFELNHGMSDPGFNKFTVDFTYNDWDIDLMFDKMLNMYTSN